MVTQKNILDAVKARMLANTSIAALIKSARFNNQIRVANFSSGKASSEPFLVLWVIDDNVIKTLDSRNTKRNFSCTIQIDIHDKFNNKADGSGLDAVMALNELIFAEFEDSDITIENAANAWTESQDENRGTPTVTGGRVVTNSDYRIFGTMA